MSPFFATTLILGIYSAALAPLAVAAAIPRARIAISAIYVIAILSLGLYQTGAFNQGSLTGVDEAIPALASADDARCGQILELIEGADLVVEPDDSGTMTLTGEGSAQLPPAARDAIIACAEGKSSQTTNTDSPNAAQQ